MGDHEGMYNGWAPNGHLTQQWIDNAQDFMDEAFRKVKGPKDSKNDMVFLRQVRKLAQKDKAGHGSSSPQLWFYERLFQVDLSDYL
jgi:hypothetical protein